MKAFNKIRASRSFFIDFVYFFKIYLLHFRCEPDVFVMVFCHRRRVTGFLLNRVFMLQINNGHIIRLDLSFIFVTKIFSLILSRFLGRVFVLCLCLLDPGSSGVGNYFDFR